MATALLPSGTAAANSDAVRQSALSSFFYSAGNLLAGIDSAPRLAQVQNDGDNGNGNLLGYGTSFGVDVGVGNNGEVYVRGQTGAVTPASQAATPISGQPASSVTLSPMVLLLIVGAAVLILK